MRFSFPAFPRPTWLVSRLPNRQQLVEAICLLFVLLFVYAALAKLWDYPQFRTQLGQSPLLTAWAAELAALVPAGELLLALGLFFPHTRRLALYGCFTLMVLFTAYIVAILHFSDYVPCSCGGVLESLSWQQHLVFNLVFTALAAGGVRLLPEAPRPLLPANRMLLMLLLLSTGLMVGLHHWSNRALYEQNGFLRVFPVHPLGPSHIQPLPAGSHYLAGFSDRRLYLGNRGQPGQLWSVGPLAGDTHTLSLADPVPRPTQIRVEADHFFLLDGRSVRRGELASGRITDTLVPRLYYSRAVPLGPNALVARSTQAASREDVLGKLTPVPPYHQARPGLLEKQIDGQFCTDGMLHYSPETRQIVYLYYYRNQFVVADTSLRLRYRAHTIDTTRRARIQVAQLPNGSRTLASPPRIVNRQSAVYGHWLIVQSPHRARNETARPLPHQATLDWYDLTDGTYRFSLTLRGPGPLREFALADGQLWALYPQALLRAPLSPRYVH